MPMPRLPELPVLDSVPALLRALRDAGSAVLSAPPGSGKTTVVPLALLDEPWLAGKRIIVLEPRRIAARMAARRMATLRGESVGETVGYQVRFERRVSTTTRITSCSSTSCPPIFTSTLVALARLFSSATVRPSEVLP